MKLRCETTGSNKAISRNTEYEVVEETTERYSIINDNGVQKNYAKKLFRVIPEILPVTVIDELNIETTATINPDGTAISFNISCSFIGRNRFNYNTDDVLFLNTTNISCGIHQISGLNNFINHNLLLKTRFENYLNEHRNTFVLNPAINLEETYKDIYTSLLQDLIAIFQGDRIRTGVLLLSTTTGSINLNLDFKAALDEISETKVVTRNPNSNNQIQMWTLLIGENETIEDESNNREDIIEDVDQENWNDEDE